MSTEGDLDRLRAAFLADPALHPRLGAIADADAFAAAALDEAARFGLSVDAEELRAALRPDPLGVERFAQTALTPGTPPPGWLPIKLMPAPQIPVEWAWFGDRPLRHSFYEPAIGEAMRLPFNRFCRFRTPLAVLPAIAQALPAQVPSGFIFHMSRCGSTLVSQMLAADPANVVVSEPAPFDTLLSLERMAGATEAALIPLMRAMIGVLGQRRAAQATRSFVKLDSWHVRRLPLIARAFPEVPWIFLYREPVEVLASQMLARGMQTLPQIVPPDVFGLSDGEATLPADEYCARMLSQTCAAALEQAGGGLLVNYRELPEAVWTRILPHFGVMPDASARAAMQDATQYNAKAPGMAFAGDGAKRDRIDAHLRDLAGRHVGTVYAALEAARAGQA